MTSLFRSFALLVLAFGCSAPSFAQQISKAELEFLTREWKGERFPDGRPKVSDEILDRMKLVTLEEAWAVLRGENFNHQYEGDWMTLDEDDVLVGRAVTATFMPGRPDIHRNTRKIFQALFQFLQIIRGEQLFVISIRIVRQ